MSKFARKQLAAPLSLALAAVTLLVYLPVTRQEFVNYDDGGHVTGNFTVKASLTRHCVKYAFTTWGVGNWHPVTMPSHMLAEYRAALKLNPDRAETHNNLANLLDNTGHPDEALAEYQEALRINPNHVASHINFGTLLVELGRFDEAMNQYAAAARLNPADWHPPYLTGNALLKQGRDREAILHFRQAVQLDPNNPRVLTYVAQVLASDEDPQVRDAHAAYDMAFKANKLTGGIQTAMLDTLAMAYAELGSFDDAQNAAQDALKLAIAYGITNDVAVIQQRLQLYQNHQPFRQSFLFTNAPVNEPRKN
jgi:Flp pilus assembly protein TadD